MERSSTGDRFELTDDFKSGFIDSLRVEQTGNRPREPLTTYFSAPRAERAEGETDGFRARHLHGLRALQGATRAPAAVAGEGGARSSTTTASRRSTYENATLELLGVPIAYMPYFWAPDPTVQAQDRLSVAALHHLDRRSAPASRSPFFWNLAPNYDLTLQPTYYTSQGVLGQVEWRHRLLTGAYNIRAAGIIQEDNSVFLPGPLGARRTATPAAPSSPPARFNINERWRWGWDVALLSDKWFLDNYRIRSESISSTYFKRVDLDGSISRARATAPGSTRAATISGASRAFDWQKQLPVVHPVLDYNKRDRRPGAARRRGRHRRQPHEPVARGRRISADPAQFRLLTCFRAIRLRDLHRLRARHLPRARRQRHHHPASRRALLAARLHRCVRAGLDALRLCPGGRLLRTIPNTTGYQIAKLPELHRRRRRLRRPAHAGCRARIPLPPRRRCGDFGTARPRADRRRSSRGRTRRGSAACRTRTRRASSSTTRSLFNWDKFSGYDRVEGGVRGQHRRAAHRHRLPNGILRKRPLRPVVPARRPNSFRGRSHQCRPRFGP